MSTIIDGSAGITFPNSTVQASAGSVIQVVNASYSTYSSTSSTSLTSTGLTVSITPKFATSKILVLVNPNIAAYSTSATVSSVQLQITRGATAIFYQDRGIAINAALGAGSVIYNQATVGLVCLDSPATTSSTTYTLNWSVNNGATTSASINNYNTITSTVGSTITLMEIAQ